VAQFEFQISVIDYRSSSASSRKAAYFSRLRDLPLDDFAGRRSLSSPEKRLRSRWRHSGLSWNSNQATTPHNHSAQNSAP